MGKQASNENKVSNKVSNKVGDALRHEYDLVDSSDPKTAVKQLKNFLTDKYEFKVANADELADVITAGTDIYILETAMNWLIYESPEPKFWKKVKSMAEKVGVYYRVNMRDILSLF
jgi:hypothetical protein